MDRAAGWISVEERLPEAGDAPGRGSPFRDVLVSTENGGVLCLGWNRIRDWNEGRILPDAKPPRISHWMPLPASPWPRGCGEAGGKDEEEKGGAQCRT